MSWPATCFLASIYWADEAMVFLVIWSIFLAAAAVTYDGSQLTMDLFSARLPARAQRRARRRDRGGLPRDLRLHGVAGGNRRADADAQRPALDRARYPDGDPHAALLVGFVLSALVVIARVALRRPVVKPMSPDDITSAV